MTIDWMKQRAELLRLHAELKEQQDAAMPTDYSSEDRFEVFYNIFKAKNHIEEAVMIINKMMTTKAKK